MLNVGLCIALFDITHIGHSYIFPGDGSSHTEVKFRYIVFRPVVEEILIGKIRSCGREGVHGKSLQILTFLLQLNVFQKFSFCLCDQPAYQAFIILFIKKRKMW